MRKIFSNAKLVLMLSICALMIASISIIVIAPSMIIEAQANALNVSSVEKYYFTPQTISSRSNSQERIEYTSYKVALDNEILTPLYYNLDSSLINVCGAVAGANLIGYYDIEYTNLIPNYDSAIIRSGKKIFKSVSTNTQNVINNLYVKMNTNATGVGVTYGQFINGLTSNVNEAGYSATIDECVSNGQISVSQDKYNKFFGKDANIDGMSEVKIQMQMTDRRFDWLQIQYKQGDLSSMIKITRYDIQPVATPEWAK